MAPSVSTASAMPVNIPTSATNGTSSTHSDGLAKNRDQHQQHEGTGHTQPCPCPTSLGPSAFSSNTTSSSISPLSSNSYDLYSATAESSYSPPRQLPHDNIILEEQAEAEPGSCCSDELDEDPAEPVTPTSGRPSDELRPAFAGPSLDDPFVASQYDYAPSRRSSQFTTGNAASYQGPSTAPAHNNSTPKPNPAVVVVPASPASLATPRRDKVSDNTTNSVGGSPTGKQQQSGLVASEDTQQDSTFTPRPPSRRPSIPKLARTMTNLFRRSNSNGAGTATPVMTPLTPANPPSNKTESNGPTSPRAIPQSQQRQQQQEEGLTMRSPSNSYSHSRAQSYNRPPSTMHTRRFSMNRTSAGVRSNTPPESLSSSQKDSFETNNGQAANGRNGDADFDERKKNRSSTGLSLRGRTINFLSPNGKAGQPRAPRRANSFDIQGGNNSHRPSAQSQHQHENDTIPPERLPWAMPPDAGTGAKARRMSLSLPDDFTVDVTELSNEFEYQHKFLGRHGKHLGKGVASKVTLIARKGFPDELYAVKEFRGKSHRESKEEYEKKIKSEFSIAKSLHHPNIVETVRLCTDHSRWNHVMEYCSGGDLFSIVQKGYLKEEGRKTDRLCLFKQLVQGVAYLHQNGIAHRDIKLENLLLTKDSKLKITDFGVSEVFCGTHPGLRESGGQCGVNMGEIRLCSPGICGSEPYIAPEVLSKKGEYDPRPLDVWSTAIVMIYLTFGGAIWNRASEGNQHYDALVRGWTRWYAAHDDPDTARITDSDYPNHRAFDIVVNPPALRRLMLQMLNPDPSRRISIHDVLNNRWFKNVECCQLESYDDPTLIIDATKLDNTRNGPKKIYCHSHLPVKIQSHSLGKMPGQPGY